MSKSFRHMSKSFRHMSKSFRHMWQSFPHMWQSFPHMWRSFPHMWQGFPHMWQSFPHMWQSFPHMWRSFPHVWQSFRQVWPSLRRVSQRARHMWQAFRQVCQSLRRVCPAFRQVRNTLSNIEGCLRCLFRHQVIRPSRRKQASPGRGQSSPLRLASRCCSRRVRRRIELGETRLSGSKGVNATSSSFNPRSTPRCVAALSSASLPATPEPPRRRDQFFDDFRRGAGYVPTSLARAFACE